MVVDLPLISKPLTAMYAQTESSTVEDGMKPLGAATVGNARTPAPIIVPCGHIGENPKTHHDVENSMSVVK